MSQFKRAAELCGLNQAATAAFLEISESSVKSFFVGRRTPNARLVEKLWALSRQMLDIAENALDMIEARVEAEGPDGGVVILACKDEAMATELGWPCKAVHDRVIAMIEAESEVPVVLSETEGTPIPFS